MHISVLRALGCAFLLLAALASATFAAEPVPTEGLADKRLARILERDTTLVRELEKRADDPEGAERDMLSRAQRIASEYESLVHDYPAFGPGFVAYGKFLQKTGHPKEAAALFMQALKADPDIAVANQQLGNWFAANDEPAKAVPLLLRAITRAPNEAIYHYDLGSILASCRDKLIADGVLTRAALDQQMVRAFTRAAELRPADLDIAFRHAESFADQEKPDWPASLSAWRALELRVPAGSTQHDAVLLQIARANLELGQPEEARKHLADVRRDTPFSDALASLKARLEQAGK